MDTRPDNPPQIKSPVLKALSDRFPSLKKPLTRLDQSLPDAGAHDRKYQPTLTQIIKAYYGIEANAMGKNPGDVWGKFNEFLDKLPDADRQKLITDLFLETQADIQLLENDGRSPQANQARKILTELALRLNNPNYLPDHQPENTSYLQKTIEVVSPLLDSNSPLRPDNQHDLAIGLLDKMFTESLDYQIKNLVAGRLTAYLSQDALTTVPQAVEQARTLLTKYIPYLKVEDQVKARQVLALSAPRPALTPTPRPTASAQLPALQPSAGD